MSDAHQPISFASAEGGDLITRASADRAGLGGFTVKRDWRFDLDQDVRREGDLLFTPNNDATNDPFPELPNVGPITLTFTARRPNGDKAFICATPSKIFRYVAFTDGNFADPTYVDSGYWVTLTGTWLVIGSGYSTSGHRWEAENVDGTIVFNNGVDPLLTYRVEEFAITPNYELREQGIAFVDSIAESGGVLLLFGVGEIQADKLAGVMNGASPYGTITDPGLVNHISYRKMWSGINAARRFGPNTTGTTTAGSCTLTIAYPMQSFSPGDQIVIEGAGFNGENLTTKIQCISGATITLADYAQTAVSGKLVYKADVDQLITGRYDLTDDASPILRGLQFQNRIVVFKASGTIFVGQYTGNKDNPYAYEVVHRGSKDAESVEAPFYRWAICSPDGKYLLYPGKTRFYTFDFMYQRPMLHPKLQLCDDLFFGAVSPSDVDLVFAVDNAFTKEVWFCYPSTTADKGLCYDYAYDKVSTIGAQYTAGALIQKPTAAGNGEDWLVLGTSDGTLVQYGRTATGAITYQRRGASFTSTLWPGRGDFGDRINEKGIALYLLLLASDSPDATVTIDLYGATNPGGAMTLLETVQFADPVTHNAHPTHLLAHLIQDRISVTGTSNVCISQRTFYVDVVASRSVVRQ